MTCLPPSQRHKSGSAPVVADQSVGIRSVLLIIKLPDSTNSKAIVCSSQTGTGASGFGHARQQSAGAGVPQRLSSAQRASMRSSARAAAQAGCVWCRRWPGQGSCPRPAARCCRRDAPRHERPCAHWRLCFHGALWRARVGCGRSVGHAPSGPSESLRSRALRSENCSPACAGAALACQRRGHQPIICPVSRA